MKVVVQEKEFFIDKKKYENYLESGCAGYPCNETCPFSDSLGNFCLLEISDGEDMFDVEEQVKVILNREEKKRVIEEVLNG